MLMRNKIVNAVGFIIGLDIALPFLFIGVCIYMYDSPKSINADGTIVAFHALPENLQDSINEDIVRQVKYTPWIYSDKKNFDYFVQNRYSWFGDVVWNELVTLDSLVDYTIYLPKSTYSPIIIDGDNVYIPRSALNTMIINGQHVDSVCFMRYSISELQKQNNFFNFYFGAINIKYLIRDGHD